tara:strand:+ start:127 stop:345 length:219 start_codon:yes stop_codon:yes gene_type:complete
MSKTNNEGLTFEEWACAVGVAKFDGDRFIPIKHYPWAKYNYPANIRKAWADGVDPTEWKAALEIRCTGRVLA